MKSLNELTAVTTLSSTDYFLVHTSSGDRKVAYSVVEKNTNPNNVYRGNSLGTVSSSNIDTFITNHGISTGVFTDIYVGDYFTASYNGTNVNFRIAGFDCYRQTGDTALTSHHVVVVPDSNLTTAAMNSTNTTGVSENENNTSEKGAFEGSDMWNITLPDVNEKLTAIFAGHLLSHREIISSAMDSNATPSGNPSWTGASSSWEWVDCQAILMSEAEVYGAPICSSSLYDIGIAKSQLPLFRLKPDYLNNRSWFWLRGVASSSLFCYCTDRGTASCNYASTVSGVRPRFLLG